MVSLQSPITTGLLPHTHVLLSRDWAADFVRYASVMGSVYSVVLMQRKCAHHMELLDREMALNDRIRVRTIMDIASEQDVVEALSSLKVLLVRCMMLRYVYPR